MAKVTMTTDSWEKDVMEHKGIVLVDFWADWCTPCKMLTPIMDDLADELEGKVKVGKLNVDENPDVSARYNVLSIPTVILFRDGKIVEQWIGVRPKGEYLESINYHLS